MQVAGASTVLRFNFLFQMALTTTNQWVSDYQSKIPVLMWQRQQREMHNFGWILSATNVHSLGAQTIFEIV